MDLLRLERSRASIGSRLVRVVKGVADELGSPHLALKAVRRFLDGTASEEEDGLVQRVLAAAGVEESELAERVARYDDLLDLLLGSVGDVGEQRSVELPLDAGAEASLGPGELALAGTLRAFVEADLDGEALDGRIVFDPEREVVLRVGVEGALEGNLKASRNLGQLAGRLGVAASSTVLVENYFRHPRSERVLDALVADLAGLDLPLAIRDAGDLRWHVGGDGLRIPDQWVHLEFAGNLVLEGGLSFAQGAVSTARIVHDALELDDVVTVESGAFAKVEFGHRISGVFDLLVSPSAHHPSRLRVELHKSVASERRLGVEVGATVGVSGLDRVARAVMSRVLPKVDRLVERLEGAVAGGVPRLRELFSARLDEELDDLLGRADVLDEVSSVLEAAKVDVDLRAALKEVLSEAGMRAATAGLEAVEEHVEELSGAVQELVRRYRGAVERLAEGVQRVAEIKVGIRLAHARQASRGRDAFLAFEIDPAARPEVFRRMLLGSFDEALELARGGSAEVRLVDGLLVESGAVAVRSDLTVFAPGFSFDSATVLSQEWKVTVTAAGDLTIGLEGEVRGIKRLDLFGSHARTLSFLADSRLMTVVGGAGGMADTAVTLELTEELRLRGRRLSLLERRLIDSGALPESTSLATELVALTGTEQLRGTATATAVLELDPAAVLGLAAVDRDRARLELALAMRELFGDGRLGELDRGDGATPVVLWPSVEERFRRAEAQPSELESAAWAPVDSSGRRLLPWSPRLTRLLFLRWRQVEAFSGMLAELAAMRRALAGLTSDELLRELRARQRRVLRHARPLVAGRVADSRINFALFAAMARLAAPGAAKPYVVVVYGERRFVFG